MPNHSPQAIANEFLRRRADSAWPQQMLIQKLAYIANGWNLAINNEPLISDQPEAWDNGPVYRAIWDHIKFYGYRGACNTLVDPISKEEIREKLSPSEEAVIDHVWRKYGTKQAHELSRMTHEPGTPWFKAYFERGKNSELNNDEIKKHYVDLAMAGRGSR